MDFPDRSGAGGCRCDGGEVGVLVTRDGCFGMNWSIECDVSVRQYSEQMTVGHS